MQQSVFCQCQEQHRKTPSSAAALSTALGKGVGVAASGTAARLCRVYTIEDSEMLRAAGIVAEDTSGLATFNKKALNAILAN